MSEAGAPVKVLVYSDDRTVREQVRLTLGTKVAADLPEIEVFEVATVPALLQALDSEENYSLMILDGEARPAGGFGVAYQVKEEVSNCPPVLLLVVRQVDSWLATWSRAEAIAPYPLDPFQLPEQVANLVRDRLAQVG
ncbi:MAG: response regulator [Tessaracoccus sp.]